jgi:osmotically inducible lipoprotein OsmB
MKSIVLICALTLSLGACVSDSPSDRAVAGGLLGAGAGAVIGGAATGRASGALAGAAIGGAGGAIVGAGTAPDRRYGGGYCRAYDEYGDPIEVSC